MKTVSVEIVTGVRVRENNVLLIEYYLLLDGIEVYKGTSENKYGFCAVSVTKDGTKGRIIHKSSQENGSTMKRFLQKWRGTAGIKIIPVNKDTYYIDIP